MPKPTISYLRAIGARAVATSPRMPRRAIELFRQVIALEPNFAQGWHGLWRALSRAIINAAGDQAAAVRRACRGARARSGTAPDAWITSSR